MRLADFLILLLQTHAQTLVKLSAFFGEENFIEILENSGETLDQSLPPSQFALNTHSDSVIWLDSPTPTSNSNAYAELEATVQELKLPEVLEFHLWAYPHYRAFIESALDLNSKIKSTPSGDALIDEAIQNAQAWVRALPIHPEAVREVAYQTAATPWLRFRTEALKKLGKRPFSIV